MAKRKTAPQPSKDDDPSKDSARPSFTIEEYNAVAARARLQHILLVAAKFDIKGEYYAKKNTGEAENIGFEIDSSASDASFLKDIGVVAGEFTWIASAKSGRKKVLGIRATYLVAYEGLDELNPEASKAFFGRVGRFAAYPYFRSLVSQMSWASEADIPILPVLKEIR